MRKLALKNSFQERYSDTSSTRIFSCLYYQYVIIRFFSPQCNLESIYTFKTLKWLSPKRLVQFQLFEKLTRLNEFQTELENRVINYTNSIEENSFTFNKRLTMHTNIDTSHDSPIQFIEYYTITKSMRALWLVNQLRFIVPVNPWKNIASSELLYKSNRQQVSMVYRLINHLGCW